MRILHLIDPAAPGGGGCTLRLLAEPLARIASAEQDVLLLGTRAHVDLARRCGVEVCGAVAPAFNHAAFARRGLVRAVRSLEQARRGRYDLVHAWTLSSAILAAQMLPRRKTVASLAVGPVSGLTTHLLMRVLARHAMPLLASSSAVEQEYRSMGLPKRAADALMVLPPAVNRASIECEPREALRERWGAEPDAFVVGLLSEPGSWADARTAIAAIARVAISGRRVRLLLHHGATRRVQAERWASSLGLHDLLILDDEVAEPWRIVHGLDAALLIGGDLNSADLSGAGSPFAILTGGGRRLRPMPGIMPLLWAMSAAVPVIAEASAAVRDIIEDGRSGLLVEQHDVNAASDRIARLYDDRTIAGRVGAGALAMARTRFDVSTYCVRLKEIWRQHIAGRPVRLVERDAPVIEKVVREEGAAVGVAGEGRAARRFSRGA